MNKAACPSQPGIQSNVASDSRIRWPLAELNVKMYHVSAAEFISLTAEYSDGVSYEVMFQGSAVAGAAVPRRCGRRFTVQAVSREPSGEWRLATDETFSDSRHVERGARAPYLSDECYVHGILYIE